MRWGVVGYGHIAKGAVLPALQKCADATLAAIITGKSGGEAPAAAYAYADFERAIDEQKIEAVYVAVPNHLHREFAERAAARGVHVLCEKPLAATVEDAEAMVAAAERAGTRLMVGYRIRFGTAHQTALAAAHNRELGELRSFHSVFTVNVPQAGNIRLRRETGGGTLPDLGIYVLHVARQLFQAEPVSVQGMTATRAGDARFAEVEEMFSGLMRFPGERVATFTCGFGSARVMTYEIVGTEGSWYADPAYDYKNDIRVVRRRVDGVRTEQVYSREDQFAKQIEHFMQAVREGRAPEPDGREGVADLRVMEELYRSARES